MRQFEIAHARIEARAAVRLHPLRHDARRNRPVVVEVDAEGGAQAVRIGVVVVLLGPVGVVDGDARGRESACAEDVVDVAGIVLLPADEADRHVAAERDVDEAFGDMADAAALDAVRFEAVAG